MTAIPNSMFDGTCIKTVTIPSNVKTIGSSAFADNDYLTSVTMDRSAERGRESLLPLPCPDKRHDE